MVSKLRWINVALRGIMEAGIVLAFAYWGYHIGTSTSTKIILTISLPLMGFGFWGAVDFHQAGKMAEPLRLTQELVISGLAAIAFYVSGHHTLCWILAALSIVHHLLVYSLGDTLLMKK